MKRFKYMLFLIFALPMLLLLGITGPLAAFSIPELIAYVRARKPRLLLGNILWPAKDQSKLTWKSVTGRNNLPVAAKVVAFGQEASIASRDGLDTVEGKIVPIKRKIQLDEETIHALYEPRNPMEYDDLIQEIYDDINNMIIAVETRLEMLKMEALTTGKIDIDEDGIRQLIDFGFDPTTQAETLLGGALWSASATCTPITDIQRWTLNRVNAGKPRPTRALTSSTQLANILASSQVSTMIYGTALTGQTVTEAQLQALLKSMNLPAIAVYDDQYRVQNENGSYTTGRYFPVNLFVLMPPEKLGDQLFSPTVEALDAVRDGSIQTAGDARRIFAMVWKEKEPPAHWTKAAALSFPTFPMVDSIFIATVA